MGRRTTWTVLLAAVLAAYVGWLGWRPEVDYTYGQVGGFALTVVPLLVLAVRQGLRPRRVVNVVFWSLLALNGFDLFLRQTGEATFWPLGAMCFGPWVWAAVYLPAAWHEDRQQHRAWVAAGSPPPPPEAVAGPPDADAQVAAWRRYRDRMTGD